MKKILGMVTALFLLVGLIPQAHADNDIAGVIFYADWCGTCKILDPRIEEARKDEASDSLSFYAFDMTDRDTIETTKALAASEGLEPLLERYGAGTGFMVIYNKDTDYVIEVITAEYSAEEIVKAFKRATDNS